MKLSNKQRAGAGLAAAGSREMAASAAASAGCAVILEEASSEGEEGDPAPPPPPPSSAPPPPPPRLLHSLSVPGHVQDTPYHKLRRASHHIISGRSQDLLQLSSRTDVTEGR